MGVLAEFDAIDRYLTLSKQPVEELGLDFEDMISFDQKVPTPMVKTEKEMLFADCGYNIPDYFTEEPSLGGPHSVNVPVYVSDNSDSPRSRGSESPNLLDLDSIGIHEESFYEERLQLKSESLVKTNCVFVSSEQFVNTDGYPATAQQQTICATDEQILYRNMMLEVKQEIHATCSTLRIDSDPQLWTADNVRQWVAWQCRKYNQKSPALDFFTMTGSEFSQLSEDEFVKRAPEIGTILFHQLDIWKSARDCDSDVQQTTQTYYQQQQSYQQQAPYELCQIPVPCFSPTPSNHSEDSIASSTNIPSPASDVEEYSIQNAPKEEACLVEEHTHKQTIQLWQFLKQLLQQPQHYSDCIKWIDRSRGIFKIENSNRVAKLWGLRKKRPAMNYDKLSRSIRQYYRKGIIKKTEHSKRLVYQFCNKYN